MLNKIIDFWGLLEGDQKKKIASLQLSVIFLGIFEMLTIGSVALYMNLVTDLSKMEELVQDYVQLPIYIGENLVIFSSLTLVLLLTLSSALSAFVFKQSILLSAQIGHRISCKLMSYYLEQDWIFHTEKNSSSIINNIINESPRLTNGIIRPLVLMISKVIVIFMISTSIFVYNPILTTLILAFFILSYMVISKVVRHRLNINSKAISKFNIEKVKSVNEAVDNIKMLLINNKKDFFLNKFEISNKEVVSGLASNMVLSSTPRYLMEWLAFVSMIFIVIFSMVVDGDLDKVIPILTVYALVAFKLLPSFQQVYLSVSTIKGNGNALSIISEELKKYEDSHSNIDNIEYVKVAEKVEFNKVISLRNVTFRYPNKDVDAIQNLSFDIEKNQTVGIVGPSGSGKSTLVNIICGLIKPDAGDILIDQKSVKYELNNWQENISYVPQSISLSDATIAENIAFGINYSEINWVLMDKVVKLAYLDELVNDLESGIMTMVGERGVQLSGGQRQRIGIARALYKNSNVLILDEATSALDGMSERKIMQAINGLAGTMTIIIIAHRLKTIQNSDTVLLLNNGTVTDQNDYETLIATNPQFREMTQLA